MQRFKQQQKFFKNTETSENIKSAIKETKTTKRSKTNIELSGLETRSNYAIQESRSLFGASSRDWKVRVQRYSNEYISAAYKLDFQSIFS